MRQAAEEAEGEHPAISRRQRAHAVAEREHRHQQDQQRLAGQPGGNHRQQRRTDHPTPSAYALITWPAVGASICSPAAMYGSRLIVANSVVPMGESPHRQGKQYQHGMRTGPQSRVVHRR